LTDVRQLNPFLPHKRCSIVSQQIPIPAHGQLAHFQQFLQPPQQRRVYRLRQDNFLDD